MRKLWVIPFLILLFFSCQAESSDTVSGSVESGLRILTVNQDTDDLRYTVYRGDYIVFQFQNEGTFQFSVPELEIDITLPKPENEKPYVKMKQSGEYTFTLGSRNGVIRVIELRERNYVELTAEEMAGVLKNTDPLIIDVRTSGEYENGHIAGSQLLPVQMFAQNLDQLEPYKNEDIILYCQSGNRSTVASRILLDAGFTNVSNLRYGIGDWIRRGYPVQ